MKKVAKADKLGLPTDLICFSAYSLSQAFNQFYRPILRKLGLTYPQYLVMVLLWRGDDRAVKEICHALNLESNTLTPLLKRLEHMELVQRTRDSRDERVVRVTLSKKGSQLQDAAEHIPKCLADSTGLSRDQLLDLIETLETLQSRLETSAQQML